MALVDLFYSTNGSSWLHQNNWLSKKSASTWYGVTVTNNRVTSLRLASNRLTGFLPKSFGNLDQLSEVVFPFNQISGPLPQSIGNLTELTDLDIEYNQLTGEIPTSIKYMQNLLYLSLYSNHLTQKKNFNPFPKGGSLISGDIGNNSFTFNGIESMVRKYRGVYYSPQAIIHLYQNNGKLSVDAGGTLSNNTYYWYKASTDKYKTIHGDSTFSPTESGKYSAKIWNAIVGNLTLYTDTIEFTATNFITADSKVILENKSSALCNAFTITPNPANNTATIQIAGSATVLLVNSIGIVMTSKIIANTGTLNVSNLANGTYFLKVKATGQTQTLLVKH